jgi:hypothetical protein
VPFLRHRGHDRQNSSGKKKGHPAPVWLISLADQAGRLTRLGRLGKGQYGGYAKLHCCVPIIIVPLSACTQGLRSDTSSVPTCISFRSSRGPCRGLADTSGVLWRRCRAHGMRETGRIAVWDWSAVLTGSGRKGRRPRVSIRGHRGFPPLHHISTVNCECTVYQRTSKEYVEQ